MHNCRPTVQRALLLLLTFAAALAAQRAPSLQLGERVRVWDSPWHNQVGQVSAVDTASLTLAIGPAGALAVVPRSRIYLLEVSGGPGSRSALAASAEWGGVGGLGGAISGAIVGDALAGGARCTSCWRNRVGAPGFGLLGATAGVLLGVTFGIRHPGEGWRPVPLGSWLGVAPTLPAGLALSVFVHHQPPR